MQEQKVPEADPRVSAARRCQWQWDSALITGTTGPQYFWAVWKQQPANGLLSFQSVCEAGMTSRRKAKGREESQTWGKVEKLERDKG